VQHIVHIIVPLGGKLTRLAIGNTEEPPRRLILLILQYEMDTTAAGGLPYTTGDASNTCSLLSSMIA